MGWSSGSELFGGIIEALKPTIPDAAMRQTVYEKLIPLFEDQDWDTQDECLGTDPAFDKAYEKSR